MQHSVKQQMVANPLRTLGDPVNGSLLTNKGAVVMIGKKEAHCLPVQERVGEGQVVKIPA